MKRYIGLTKSPVRYKIYEAWTLVKVVKRQNFWLNTDNKLTAHPNRAKKFYYLSDCPKLEGFKRKRMNLVNGIWSFGKHKETR